MIKFLSAVFELSKNPPPPNWHIEEEAKRSPRHPLGGFWKVRARDAHGLAIGPYSEDLYFVSFCGPGGCFKKGTYRPNTTIFGDENYRVIDLDTIEVKGKKGFERYERAVSREST